MKRYLSWRDRWRPIIARIIAQHVGPAEHISPECMREIRKALRHHWTVVMMQPCKYWPYTVWLDEIGRQTGRRLQGATPQGRRPQVPEEPDPRQMGLFGG